MTDPKAAAGSKKCPLHLLPTAALRYTAQVLLLGATKYGEYNWRRSGGIEINTYVAAMMRHLTQFMDGEDFDEESGITHLAHIAATCFILIDAAVCGKLIDNRYKKPKED